ncbi:hypothetical protein ACFXPS_33795 [Nocardia sp. NPDC059091]|uniref:hypothetical protein n=1 Tax=unclassified Nocardia TaxID=2637762 RepID=UPI0036CAFDA1
MSVCSGDLVVAWRPPGWKIGIATALVGFLGLALLHWLYRRERRAGDLETGLPADDFDPLTGPLTPVLV